MSKLGNIQESYGKQITIAVANTYSANVLASTSLPKNALIIASPTVVDEGTVYDYGTYDMIITDNFSNPVRLTYTIQQGNGLTTDYSNTDIIRLNIDDNTLTTNEYGELTINKQNIIDNDTLIVNENNQIEVNINNLTHAGLDTLGVVKIDNETLKTTTSGQLYVETENLDRANDSQYGVVTSDNNTIYIDSNGVLSVNTKNLDKATSTTLGIVRIDNKTFKTTANGHIYVSTSDLTQASDTNMGVAKVDDVTMTATTGVLSVNVNGLTHASNTEYGLVKYDNSIVIQNGIASVRDYDTIFSLMENEKTLLLELQNTINKLQDVIGNNMFGIKGGIYSLSCNDTTITNLAKPTYLEEPLNMKTQHVYVSMNVITDCDFNISIIFDNNETPAIELSQINYNDEFSYQGFDGLLKTYPSTNMKQKHVVLLFNCKNFKATAGKYEKTTKITITVSSTENKEINKKLLYSIVRYNSNIEVKDTIDGSDSIKNKITLIPIQSESYWKEDKKHINNRRGYRNISELEN